LGAALLREGERLRLADFPAIDLVISTGGTYLVEQYGTGSRVFQLLMAGALGVPVVLYTQSLGPFRARRNRPRLRMVFSASPLVLLRDERSRRHLRDLGVPGAAVHVVADAVFGRERARPFAQPVAKRVRSVAVSVREWPPGADAAGPAMVGFRRAVAAALTGLVGQHSADVTFLSTCQGIPEYWTDDSTVAEAVAAELPGDVRRRVRVDRAFHGPDALAEAYAAFDMVLATWMHAAILALTAGTPVLPIAYEFKTTELFEALGLGDYVVSIDGIDDDRLLARTRVFVDELPGLIGICRAGVEAERAQARRAEEMLAGVVERLRLRA
jgi:colanic acid/amylovoran biosynthesis protein